MPWTLNDYPDSMKNLTKTTRKKAIDIANAMTDEGYDDNRAIPIAIEQAKEWSDHATEKQRKEYLEEGDVEKHDGKYASNPALLDEDELVFWKDDKWAVQSKQAKKASKLFDRKEDAIQYGKEVAKNKGTKLIVYLQDGAIDKTHRD